MTLRIVISFILLIIFISCIDMKRYGQQEKLFFAQNDSIRILQSEIDSFSKANKNLNEDLNFWFNDEEIKELKTKEIQDPITLIQNNLYNHPNLIPYPGVLGGTMQFGKITLLGDRWVIANFDDGHIDGVMLLRYKIRRDSSIKWTIIDSYLK